MQLSPLTTLRCIFTGHQFETLLIRCNGSHFICRRCGLEIWRPVCPNDGDKIESYRNE
jgi:hypothetical protein|nr:MAG TPA: DNA-directed RNA polymerase [Caudoviricetes sp.]